jgi:hypothetical protein
MPAETTDFDHAATVGRWEDIPGWFGWREGQQEAVNTFPSGGRFVEVGVYLGRSLCSLGDVAGASGRTFAVTGVDTCQGSGPEGSREVNAHGPAVERGGGTFAGELHRNILACGLESVVQLVIADSVSAARIFANESVAWVHIDARHDYDSVKADIAAWAPKVMAGGWLSGDDYNPDWWPGVVAAVNECLPDASRWCSGQWRWLKPV